MKIQMTLLVLVLSMAAATGQSLSAPFEDCGIKGSITLYDYREKKWISSDIRDSRLPTLPASTFKILNTLIALETGVIADENTLVAWPGSTDTAKYMYRPRIYHDMTLREAFRLSAGWVYVELAKKIGKERYKDYLARASYGNGKIFNGVADFWNYGNFAVSPASQIASLIGIYEETLPPFSKRSFSILKDMMIQEKTATYILRAKTGWSIDHGKDTGWWVGYIERRDTDDVYFFATRIIKDRKTPNPDFRKCRKQITRRVLRQLGMIE